MQKKPTSKLKKKPEPIQEVIPVPEVPPVPKPRYGIFMTHPFMGKPHGRALTKEDPIPMNFSCNVTEIGGALYSNMITNMVKMFEQYDIIPTSSTPEAPVDMKAYISSHKEKDGPLEFFALFAEPPMDFIEFCKKHRLTFRIHEWPTANPNSNYRVHTFLPDEGNTVYSSFSGIDKRGWLNGEQFRRCIMNGTAPSEGYFAAHEKKIPDFKLSTW